MSSVLYVFQKQLLSVDDSILICTLEAVFCLSLGPNENIEVVVSSGIVSQVVYLLLSHLNQQVKFSALRVIGNIVTGSEHHTQGMCRFFFLENDALFYI